MAGLIGDLMGLLKEMSGHIGGLLVLSKEKKEVIIKNDTDTLKAITSKENALVGKYQRTEKNMQAVLEDIAMVLGQPARGMTLGRVGELIEEQDDYPAYMEIYNSFSADLYRLKDLNDQNRVLIESALDYIDYTVNAIRSSHGMEDMMHDSKN